ncbi:MAG: NDP-sugar synthase [Planctomycetota bacterium]|nr:NDP-sugar synthase [Planctomycetota bacterium]
MEGRVLKIIMLAGGLRASAFRQQLGIPTLRLPLGSHPSLLDAWLTSFESIGLPVDVHIIVSWEDDVRHLDPLIQQRLKSFVESQSSIEISTDPSPWRGTGGLIYDVTSHLNDDDMILVVESSCIPPESLSTFLQDLDDQANGLVCCSAKHEPAGLYLFRKAALNVIPEEGFFDLKEQLLPILYQAGERLIPVVMFDEVLRVRDREMYLRTVHGFLNGTGHPLPIVSEEASIAPSARVLGASVIEAGVMIEDGAIVHESVILKGATIERDALVSRSIVGSRAHVNTLAIIRDTVVPFDAKARDKRESPRTKQQVSSKSRKTVEVGA